MQLGPDPGRFEEVRQALVDWGGLEASWLLSAGTGGYRPLLVEPDRGATEELGAHLAARLGAPVLRIGLFRSRRLELTRHEAGREPRCLRWPAAPAREGEAAPGLAPDATLPGATRAEIEAIVGPVTAGYQGPPYLLAEELLEDLGGAAGLEPREVAVGGRALAALRAEGQPLPGAVPLALPAPKPPLTTSVGAAAGPFLDVLLRPARVSVLAVLQAGVSPERAPELPQGGEGFRQVLHPRLERHGPAGLAHLAATTSLIGLGKEQIERRRQAGAAILKAWARALPVAQGLVAQADWDPTLQVDATPWEAAWRAPALAERTAGWERRVVRGLGEAVLVDEALREGLGPLPAGLREGGGLIWAPPEGSGVLERWLGPRIPPAGPDAPLATLPSPRR